MSTAGVIILGNLGVGKSFLSNVILGQEAFKHAAQARAVTLTTEYKECQINSKQYAVYNVPGLIENDQERIDINKREIDRAFRQHPYAVVLYVCGAANSGRVRLEDAIAFRAINDAYPLGEKSLIIIFNDIPTNLSSGDYPKYESETTSHLKQCLGMDLKHICFIYRINTTSTTEKQAIQTKLLDKIKIALPKTH
jgi:GTPase Era involved in 16S rRNA processing